MDILVPISAIIPADVETPTVSFDVPSDDPAPVRNPQYIRLPLSRFNPEPTPHPRHRHRVNLDAPIALDGTLGPDTESVSSACDNSANPEADSEV